MPELKPTEFTRFLRELSASQALRVRIAVDELPPQKAGEAVKVRLIRVAAMFQISVGTVGNHYYRIKAKQKLKFQYKQAA